MNDAQGEYERWVRPMEVRMMRTVWRIVRDPDETEDAFQQALETIRRRWERIRRHPNPPALIMTICVHAAYDHLRRRSRRVRHEVSDQFLEGRASRAPGLDAIVAGREAQAMIYAEIARLPGKQRSTIVLRLLGDLSYDAIAEALGCSEATARTHCMRAMKRLRSQLAPLRPATGREA